MATLFKHAFKRALLVERSFLQVRCMQISAVMNSERRYTKKHEWVSVKDNIGTVGITDFAAEQLGDVVYVELPDVGSELEKGQSTGAVESVKAASDVYAPVSGTVTEKNSTLEEESGRINKSPFGDGWMYKLKVKDASELSDLLTEEQYEEFKHSEDGH